MRVKVHLCLQNALLVLIYYMPRKQIQLSSQTKLKVYNFLIRYKLTNFLFFSYFTLQDLRNLLPQQNLHSFHFFVIYARAGLWILQNLLLFANLKILQHIICNFKNWVQSWTLFHLLYLWLCSNLCLHVHVHI